MCVCVGDFRLSEAYRKDETAKATCPAICLHHTAIVIVISSSINSTSRRRKSSSRAETASTQFLPQPALQVASAPPFIMGMGHDDDDDGYREQELTSVESETSGEHEHRALSCKWSSALKSGKAAPE